MRALAAAASAAVLALVLGGMPAAAASTALAASRAAVAPAAVSPAAVSPAATTTSTDDPLVIVLDVSGSMDDDDGSGSVKLASAKSAVERAVRARGEGSTVGVWAFPDSASCSSGGFIVDPERLDERSSVHDTASVIAKVDAMVTRDGGTPIGKALHDSADALTARGFTSATMLLVTDGLNTCDPDPCEAAKDVRASGFDLTVDSIGFRTEDAADDALTCIARTTGGSFTDADDGKQLEQTLAGLAVPKLEMQVGALPMVRAGSSPTVSVTVTNPSSNDAADVRTSLVFRRTDGDSIMPAVVPPVYRLGTIPARGKQTRTWTLNLPTGIVGRTGDYTVTAWAETTGATQQRGRFEVTDQGLQPADRIFGALHGGPLVILGDSFSAGEGAEAHIEDYLPGTSDASALCHRSKKTYLAPVIRDTVVLACSGAVTQDYEYEQQKGDGTFLASPQAQQLRGMTKAPGAVVFTFGGNDVGFSSIISDCVTQAVIAGTEHTVSPLTRLLPSPGVPNCSGTTRAGQQKLRDVAALANTLEPLYREIWLDANTPEFVAQRHGAYAPVVVSTYPQPFLPSRYGRCSLVWSRDGVEYGNRLTAALMSAAKLAATRAAKDGYEIYFAPKPLDAFQTDHTYCASDAETDLRRLVTPDWTHGTGMLLTGNLASQQSMHPNARGYAATTDALFDWAATLQRVAPSGEAIRKPVPAGVGGLLSTPVPVPPATVRLNGSTTVQLQPGQTLDLTVDGYAPGAVVTIVLHSSPTVLGSAVADAHGTARLRAVVPASVATGRHELQADGPDSKGGLRLVTAPAAVVQPMPLWVAAAGVAAVLVLLLVLVVGIRTARRPRP